MKTVTLFGDSILYGIIINENNRYARNKEFNLRVLGTECKVDLLNLSRMGRNSREGIDTVNEYLQNHEVPDYAVIEFGGNDADHEWDKIALDPSPRTPKIPMQDYLKNLVTMADILTNLGTKVSFMNLPPVLSQPYFDWVTKTPEGKQNVLKFLGDVEVINQVHSSYNQAVEKLAHDTSIPLIDIRKPFFAFHTLDELICVDGVHPSPKGYALIKEEIKKYLLSL